MVTFCGDHFMIRVNIESLFRIPETNITLYINYSSIKINNNKVRSPVKETLGYKSNPMPLKITLGLGVKRFFTLRIDSKSMK